MHLLVWLSLYHTDCMIMKLSVEKGTIRKLYCKYCVLVVAQLYRGILCYAINMLSFWITKLIYQFTYCVFSVECNYSLSDINHIVWCGWCTKCTVLSLFNCLLSMQQCNHTLHVTLQSNRTHFSSTFTTTEICIRISFNDQVSVYIWQYIQCIQQWLMLTELEIDGHVLRSLKAGCSIVSIIKHN